MKELLKNKIAIVTGGGRGIGRGHSLHLAKSGAAVLVNDIDSEEAKKVVKEILNEGGVAKTSSQDISSRAGCSLLIEECIKEFGNIDILVNNAGVAKHGEMEDYNDDLLDSIMDINVDSVFRMCRSAITPMKNQGEGVILNIGSISGLVSNIPQPQVAYNASKAAVHMMTKSLASDFADKNIRVNALAPGYFRTEMTSLPKENEHWYPTWDKMTPLNRMGETHEIGSAALFLCSPASSYITGEVLVIDGGYTTR